METNKVEGKTTNIEFQSINTINAKVIPDKRSYMSIQLKVLDEGKPFNMLIFL